MAVSFREGIIPFHPGFPYVGFLFFMKEKNCSEQKKEGKKNDVI